MSIQPVNAAKTRRGAIGFLLAFLALALAVGMWAQNNAQAALPTTSIVLNDDAGATENGGDTVDYTFDVDFTGTVAKALNVVMTANFDDDLIFVSIVSAAGNFDTTECSNGAGNVITCTDNDAGNHTSGDVVVRYQLPFNGNDVSAPTACSINDNDADPAVNCTINAADIAVDNPVTASPTSATNAQGMSHTITFALPINVTCATDDDADDNPETDGDELRQCPAGDVNLDGATLLSGPTVSSTNLDATATVTVEIVGDNDTYSVSLDVVGNIDDGTDANAVTFTSQAATKEYVDAEFRHVDDDGNIIDDQDIANNVRGKRHVICVFTGDSDSEDSTPLQIPLSIGDVATESGGGYDSTSDPDPTVTDAEVDTGDGMGFGETSDAYAATCYSWISTEAGDQEINAEYQGDDGNFYEIDWDTDESEDGNGNNAIIKEWNVLEDSTVTLYSATVDKSYYWIAGTSTLAEGTSDDASSSHPTAVYTMSAIFDPSDSTYTGTPIYIVDKFDGSHVDRTGDTYDTHDEAVGLWGVDWTATIAGDCGYFSEHYGDYTDTDYQHSGTTDETGAIALTLRITGDDDCQLNDTIVITITGDEPDPLGSGDGNTVTQVIVVKITTLVGTKQVFLAWAGQRVILEHDWRIPPGDTDGGDGDDDPDPTTSSACAFAGAFTVSHIKGSGPGNFVAGLGASLNGSDQADVIVNNHDHGDNSQSDDGSGDGGDDDSDIIADPQDSCISRVIFESEDQGQVDVEAFVTSGEEEVLNQTKIAFVIYYMKLESVSVSLVDDVSRPLHNAPGSDFAPGNPWDASKDVTTVDWNVSKDLLVRGRVKGWFTTSNTTGRAAGTDTNGGGLPAGRWVMPDDWPLLAGGPADPADGSDATGIAEAYRPEFDLMFAPNNKLGRALSSPSGTDIEIVAGTLTASAVGDSDDFAIDDYHDVLYVSSVSALAPGACIRIGNEYMAVEERDATTLTIRVERDYDCTADDGHLEAHAKGSVIYLQNVKEVPFEGPYSLLDIPGLAASGLGGAALSEYDPNNIRDTIWGDVDVDMWDAPMPPALITTSIRGAGFIKDVLKENVYYNGTANDFSTQTFPNPFYITNIPDSPFIPAVVGGSILNGGGYFWDSWADDGPGGDGDGNYWFWEAVKVGSNMWGVGDSSVTALQAAELAAIREFYGDVTLTRDFMLYSDNHGEFMVIANGDFKLDYSGCAANALGGGKHCKPGDKAGASIIYAVGDYPDFRGKHYPLLSNLATVNWTWGGYKDVTIEAGETEQYKYVVFHALDRDGFCDVAFYDGTMSLHPVLSDDSNGSNDGDVPTDTWSYTDGSTTKVLPPETVDFMIDSGEGIILTTSAGESSSSTYTKQFAEGVPTFSTGQNDPATSGLKEFPLSSLAATGATDECQAWIKVSNSLLGILNVLVVAHDDEGDIGFDKIIDLQSTMSYSLNFRWSLITWAGKDGIATADALKGSGGSTNDITSSVTAVYGWDAAAQAWLGYFPSAVPVPGANDLTKLNEGDAYWVAITGPGSVTWTIATHVN